MQKQGGDGGRYLWWFSSRGSAQAGGIVQNLLPGIGDSFPHHLVGGILSKRCHPIGQYISWRKLTAALKTLSRVGVNCQPGKGFQQHPTKSLNRPIGSQGRASLPRQRGNDGNEQGQYKQRTRSRPHVPPRIELALYSILITRGHIFFSSVQSSLRPTLASSAHPPLRGQGNA